MEKNEDWRIDWIESIGCKFWYTTGENEVWKRPNKLIVWHPELGLRIMLNTNDMSEKIQKEVIESILFEQQEKINLHKKLRLVPTTE